MLQTMNDGFNNTGIDSSNLSSINKVKEFSDEMPKHYPLVGYDSESMRVPHAIKYNTVNKTKKPTQLSVDREKKYDLSNKFNPNKISIMMS